ncbi:DUF3179 domain-containing (seleno)protein [Halobaculum sp. MBLA0147]|uniref:DUF3179 domain-containing (seleno)protein n=1 Tax=Halobaculum sp. MBLA0147 TaxID=3079934 RepID=UPI003526BC89
MNVVDVLPRDAIPPVYDPAFEPVDAYPYAPDDDVVVVEIDGAVRGYPIRYLTYHEIVDDELAGVPIAVTWCPLCGSVLVFDRRVDDRTLTFGVSGKLADDTLVMYDHETGSEWKQSLSRAIAGELAGTELTVLPAAVTTYERFRETHPDAAVLAAPGGASETASDDDEPAAIDYVEESFADYFESDGFGLGGRRPDAESRSFPLDWLDPKTVVCGLEHDGDAVGVPRPVAEAAGGVVTVTVGGTDVVVFATPDGLHAFHDPGFDWTPVDDGGVDRESGVERDAHGEGVATAGGTGAATRAPVRFSADGSVWDGATGRAVGDDGRAPLERFPAIRLFAYGWVDNHGTEAFYRD